MTPLRAARRGGDPASAAILSPPGRLLRLDRPPLAGEGVRAACLALDQDRAEMLIEALEHRRRRAIGWARRRYRMLPAGLRARLGGLVEAPILTEAGCAECRGLTAPTSARRLCVFADRGGATAALDAGGRARLRLCVRPIFIAAAGTGGLSLTLLSVEDGAGETRRRAACAFS